MYSSSISVTITFVILFAGRRSNAAPLVDNRDGNSINSVVAVDEVQQDSAPWRTGRDDTDSKLTFKGHVESPLWEDFSTREGNTGVKNYSGYKLLRAHPTMAQTPRVDSLGDNKNGVEVWNWRQARGEEKLTMDVLTPPHQLETLEELFKEINLTYEVVIEDLQTYIDSEKDECQFFCSPPGAHPMDWEKYHDIKDMDGYMTYLEQSYTDRVKIIEIGKSFEKRPLQVMRISSGEFDPSKPAIWVDGGMHGREWVAPATAMYLIRQLVEYGHIDTPDSNATNFFNWYILPVANPDGYEYSRHHDRLWRKTRSLHPEMESSGCVGVDANRNFGHKWNQDNSSTEPCSEEYAGPSSFSEPETKAIRDFLTEKKEEIKMYLTLHAYSQMVLYPESSPKKNSRELDELATVITDTINKQPANKIYTHGSVNDLLYRSYGTSDDYAMGELQIPYAFSLELRDLGQYGFILPPGEINSTSHETYTGVVAMVNKLHEKLNATAES